MATSFTTYTGDGAVVDFTPPLHISQSHIAFTVDGVAATFTWFNSTTVRADVAPANDTAVRVARTTPTTPLVDFTDGSVLTEANLDLANLQALYIAAEAVDNVGSDTASDASAAAASALASAASATAAAGSAVEAAASAVSAALFDPDAYNTTVEQAGIDAAQDVQTALKAPIDAPTFTGIPAVPTAAPGTDTTQAASTAFVEAAVAAGGISVSASSIATPGYRTWSDGLIEQWGSFSAIKNTTTSDTFAIPFPTALFSVVLGPGRHTGGAQDNPSAIHSVTLSGLTVKNEADNDSTCYWYALGN